MHSGADDRPQRRQVRDAVELGARHGGQEGRVGERVHRVYRAGLDRRDAPVIDPPAGSQPGQDSLPGRPDLAGGQQAAEEQVPIAGQAPTQSIRVTGQGRGIGQLIHKLTISTSWARQHDRADPGLVRRAGGSRSRRKLARGKETPIPP